MNRGYLIPALLCTALTVSVIFALTWAGASAAGPAKDTLVIAIPIDIDTPDVNRSTGLPAIGVSMQIYDLVVHHDGRGQIRPWLAESWTTEDGGRSVVFKIRDNVRMHDGRVLSAEDVVFSIERFRRVSIARSQIGF